MYPIEHYITQVTDRKEFSDILHRKGFDINMRLFKECEEYRNLIKATISYMRSLLSKRYTNFSAGGISGANIGIPLNIIGFNVFPNKIIMLNPKIIEQSKETITRRSGCGSIASTRNNLIKIIRPLWIKVSYYDDEGKKHTKRFNHKASAICHEIDHNLGILITDAR